MAHHGGEPIDKFDGGFLGRNFGSDVSMGLRGTCFHRNKELVPTLEPQTKDKDIECISKEGGAVKKRKEWCSTRLWSL